MKTLLKTARRTFRSCGTKQAPCVVWMFGHTRVMDLTTLVSGHLRYFSLGSPPLIKIQSNRNYGRRSGAWARNGS